MIQNKQLGMLHSRLRPTTNSTLSIVETLDDMQTLKREKWKKRGSSRTKQRNSIPLKVK